ncbi:hypothetical protein [Streptomyces sp. NPDC051286]|uniref:hypothetical protein n=1 Tax=Streptomyces sp. NPDC051286 TaxID=3365647 RepID=UPI0037A42D55
MWTRRSRDGSLPDWGRFKNSPIGAFAMPVPRRHERRGTGQGDPEDLAHISPYLAEHIKRFGKYSTHELGIQPEAYNPKLDIDFTPLRDQDLTTAGFGQAA